MFDKELFSQRLRELRKSRKISQAQLGEFLGVTATQVGDMERGNSTTSLARLYQLCVFFNVSADYLLGLSDDPERKNGDTKEPPN